MNNNELFKALKELRTDNHHFIKLWRKENDFVDIFLIDSFLEMLKGDEEFESFDLLDMGQLWEIVKRLCGDRVMRTQQEGHEVINWVRIDKQGAKRTISCSFAPEFLLQIFDIETRGNYIE